MGQPTITYPQPLQAFHPATWAVDGALFGTAAGAGMAAVWLLQILGTELFWGHQAFMVPGVSNGLKRLAEMILTMGGAGVLGGAWPPPAFTYFAPAFRQPRHLPSPRCSPHCP